MGDCACVCGRGMGVGDGWICEGWEGVKEEGWAKKVDGNIGKGYKGTGSVNCGGNEKKVTGSRPHNQKIEPRNRRPELLPPRSASGIVDPRPSILRLRADHNIKYYGPFLISIEVPATVRWAQVDSSARRRMGGARPPLAAAPSA